MTTPCPGPYPVTVRQDDDLPGIDAVVQRVLVAFDRLADLGEQVEDEWQYVADLRTVYRGRLSAVASELGARRDFTVTPELVAAVDAAVEETALIADPHRAIDWLSTLPQVVLLALGADA